MLDPLLPFKPDDLFRRNVKNIYWFSSVYFIFLDKLVTLDKSVLSFRPIQEQCTHTALTVTLLTERNRCSILDTMAAVSPFTASPSSQSLFPRKKRTFYKITSTNLHLFCLSLGVKNRYIQWKPADYIQPFTVASIRIVSPKTLPVAFSQITLPT